MPMSLPFTKMLFHDKLRTFTFGGDELRAIHLCGLHLVTKQIITVTGRTKTVF